MDNSKTTKSSTNTTEMKQIIQDLNQMNKLIPNVVSSSLKSPTVKPTVAK